MKPSEYAALVAERKRCNACAELVNPVTYAAFDSEHIGPWTRLHGDLDAALMVVGQDWGDLRYYEANRGLDKLNNPTMVALASLLASIGFDVPMDRYGQGNSGVFLTNAVLCLKAGGLQGSVRRSWFLECAQRFLRRQVEIVRPRVVVPLGEKAHQALRHAFGLPPARLRRAVAEPGIELLPGTMMVAVYHCGRRIQNTHRPLDMQYRDWERVRVALARPGEDAVAS